MPKIDLAQIVVGILVGAVIGVASTVFLIGTKTAQLEEKVRVLEADRSGRSAASSSLTAAPSPSQPTAPAAEPAKLIEIVKREQRRHVRISFGELAHESFTDADLRNFVNDKRAARITEDLRSDKEFLEVILALQAAAPRERQRILEASRATRRPTWGELGRISKDGQTEAGQKAETMIADSIVGLAEELLSLPRDTLSQMYAR